MLLDSVHNVTCGQSASVCCYLVCIPSLGTHLTAVCVRSIFEGNISHILHLLCSCFCCRVVLKRVGGTLYYS